MAEDLEGLAGDLESAIERLVGMFRSLNTTSSLSRTASATLSTLVQEGPSRLTALATRESVSQPAMTQLVDRLVAQGLVRRDHDPSDGRVVLVSVTDEGRAVLARRRTTRAQQLTALLAQLEPESRGRIAAALPALEALVLLHADDHPVAV